MKKLVVSIIALLSFGISACSSNNASRNEESSSSTLKTSKQTENKKSEKTPLQILNQLAKSSKSTDEMYVTGPVLVGEKQPLKPGIYDLEITGGNGNINGTRKYVTGGMSINWIGAAPGGDDSPVSSKFRVVLFNGDKLEFRDISKVKFTAVPEKVTPSNQLGEGDYIVGRDIPAGTYKLSTNAKLDPEYDNLEWRISIYDDISGDSKDQTLNPKNSDVAVTIKNGEIITTSCDISSSDMPIDTAKLTFTPMK